MRGTRHSSPISSWPWSMWAWSASCSTAPSRPSVTCSPAAPPRSNGGSIMAYLKIDHVGISFQRAGASTEVLRDVNLSIEKGDYVSIIGHSGCGKSTVLNIVAGLLEPSQGGVLLEGRAVSGPGPDRAV